MCSVYGLHNNIICSKFLFYNHLFIDVIIVSHIIFFRNSVPVRIQISTFLIIIAYIGKLSLLIFLYFYDIVVFKIASKVLN